MLPVAVYGLEVPSGDVIVPAIVDFPATFRITMAAIDPSEHAELEETANGTVRPRATLKIIRAVDEEDDEDEEENEEYMRALLAESDSEESESDDEANGGPSDPAKSKKARKAAALQQLMESISADADSDEDMEDAEDKVDKKKKGKATVSDDEDSDSGSDGESEIEEFVLCTLDPERNYQQPLDITIAEGERVYFKVTGTHTVFLTGNYVVPDDNGHNHHHEIYDSDDEDDEDYDLSPDEDELDLEDLEGDDSDDLDALEDPRITEVDSEEEEAPKLVAVGKKGKNKRTAEELETPASLDDLIAKSKPEVDESKLSKKQLKKLKKNNGEAAPAKAEEQKNGEVTPAKSDKSDKKVQFAKNLEQGPTGSAEKAKADSSKAALGVKTINGVKVDDKKIGTGPACKKGSKVGMRYIGKLTDGKVFDSNTKGKPFSFKLGSGEVIKGWDIGVAGMQVGGERRLTIPPQHAYGSKKLPGIPANSTLVFDIKLLEIK